MKRPMKKRYEGIHQDFGREYGSIGQLYSYDATLAKSMIFENRSFAKTNGSW